MANQNRPVHSHPGEHQTARLSASHLQTVSASSALSERWGIPQQRAELSILTNVTRETSYLRVAMNTTNPLGGIHAALDRYEADGRPPAAELPPTRGAEAALLELGGSRPRFALAPEPRLSLDRTDTGLTRSDSMTETSELLTSLAHARVPPPSRRPPPPPRIITFSPPGPRRLGWVGAYSPEARKRRIARFHAKRKRRVWKKSVQYDVRKSFADTRLRVKGRFVKKEDEVLLKELVGLA